MADAAEGFDLEDIDALLEGMPVKASSRSRLDYAKWEDVAAEADAEADEEPTAEQRELWQRMVEASGLAEEADEERIDAWKVVHAPRVAVREGPSVNARLIGAKKCGDVVQVDWTLESIWVKLKDEDGWMLTHGGELGLGQLLLPCGGAYGDAAPVA